jgi:hypothetical protein
VTCLRLPQSLADANAIIAACAGPGWRTDFLLGLGTLLFFGLLLVLVLLAMKGRA